MYEDTPTPAGQARPPQGQHCPGCGRLEPDLWARFCGVCGTTLGPGGGSSAATVHLKPSGGTAAARAGWQPAAHPADQPLAAAPYRPLAEAAPYRGPGNAGGAEPVVYTVPSVGFGGPARIGAAVSAAFTLLPCVFFAFVGAWLIHAGRRLLDSWQTASVRIPAVVASIDLRLNFIDLMQLRPIYDLFMYWDERLWLAFAILWLVPWFVWIVAGALFAVLLAAIYNLIGRMGGGVRVTMRPASLPPASPPSWPPAPTRGTDPMASPGWPAEGRR